MLVVDASVVVVALSDDGPDGERVRGRLHGESLTAPELLDLEVLSVLRRLTARGQISARRAQLAVADLVDLAVHRVAHLSLISRCWALRSTVSPYDAAYAALAELLSAPLLTADERLSRAPGPRCQIEVIRRAENP